MADTTKLQLALAAWGILHAVGGLVFGWIPMVVRDRNHMNVQFRALQGSTARRMGFGYLLVAVLALVHPVAGILAMMVAAGIAWYLAGADEG
jgi:hypothetical protein